MKICIFSWHVILYRQWHKQWTESSGEGVRGRDAPYTHTTHTHRHKNCARLILCVYFFDSLFTVFMFRTSFFLCCLACYVRFCYFWITCHIWVARVFECIMLNLWIIVLWASGTYHSIAMSTRTTNTRANDWQNWIVLLPKMIQFCQSYIFLYILKGHTCFNVEVFVCCLFDNSKNVNNCVVTWLVNPQKYPYQIRIFMQITTIEIPCYECQLSTLCSRCQSNSFALSYFHCNCLPSHILI